MIKRSGFTIVEILVVIVVIAILATLATFGAARLQQDSRDTRRSVSVTSIAEALEKYYDRNGEYPSCEKIATSINGASSVLEGIDVTTLVVPGKEKDTNTSIRCDAILSSNGEDFFEYVGDGSPECANGGACLSYTIRYKKEESNTVQTLASRRTTTIATSGVITATAGAVTYVTSNISWTPLANATGYTVERDTTNAFNSSNLRQIGIPAGTNTYQSTDVGPGVNYFYRIKASSISGDSSWSNTANRTTTALPAPTIATTQDLPDRVTGSWNNVSGVSSYTIQRGTTSAYTTIVNNETGSATSRVYSDTPIGTERSYRVRANVTNASGTTFNSAWSSTSYTSFVPAPSAPSVSSAISGSTATGTSGTATCVQNGTPQYALRETRKANSGSTDSWTSWTSWSPTVRTYSVGALQGHQHTFQSAANCTYGGASSATTYSPSTASSVQSINQPARPTWPTGLSKSWPQNTYGHYMWFNTSCPSGTWAGETWFHSWGWVGNNVGHFYHEFGFNDYWILGPSGGATVEYEARYTCVSSYTGSSWSPLSYDTLWVY